MSRGSRATPYLIGPVLAATLLAACPAMAENRTFHLPAEAAVDAIPAFAQQSGMHILANVQDLSGIRTNAVQGTFDPDQALARLIAGTGLTVEGRETSAAGTNVVLSRMKPAVSVTMSAVARRPPDDDATLVVVNGFRDSLENAAAHKRRAVNVTDSVFAEDFGKFPDLNLAEALQRVPGVQLTRDQITGEGLQVAIRALDPSFTTVLIDGNRIEVASDGGLDGGSSNRQTDLDLFPSELFSRIVISKTPRAEQPEGGIAGTVDLANIRPFDRRGVQTTFWLNDGYGQSSRQWSPRGAAIASRTWDHWGVLVGIAGQSTAFETDGFETIGWSNANLDCPGCDNSRGNAFSFAATVPANAGNGLVAGAPVDYAALNPGVTVNQLTNTLVPRLARNVLVDGRRTGLTGLVSLEYRGGPAFHTALDLMWGHFWRSYARDDADWLVRNSGPMTTGGMVPIGITLDANNVLMSGTFANSALFDQSAWRTERLDYKSLQPSLTWRPNLRWRIDADASMTRSTFRRGSVSYLFDTPFNSGLTLRYVNNGSLMPSLIPSRDPNDPNLGWTFDRATIQDMRRVTDTWGAHVSATYHFTPEDSLKAGYAWDRATRTIFAWDNSNAYQTAFSLYVPQAQIAGYLRTSTNSHYLALVDQGAGGFRNFVTADMTALMAATHYADFEANAPVSTAATVQGTPAGSIDETYRGLFIQFDGRTTLLGRTLRFDAGVRSVRTRQAISGPVIVNGALSYPGSVRSYSDTLPSANLAWAVAKRIDLRLALSRTLSRPNPTSLLPGTAFTDPSAQIATQGNPALRPYHSDNIDASADLYTGTVGYVSLALFRKRITGFTYASQVIETFNRLGIDYSALTVPQQQAITANGGPNAANVIVNTQLNADSLLTLRGLELTWVQPLDRLYKGLGFSANYTALDPRYSGTTNLATGIAPFSYNITAYYEAGDVSAHISYVYQASRQTLNSPQNGLPVGLYALGRGQIDLSAAWTLRGSRTSRLTLDATNLTNAPYVMVFGYRNAPYSIYNPGFQILLGWQGRF